MKEQVIVGLATALVAALILAATVAVWRWLQRKVTEHTEVERFRYIYWLSYAYPNDTEPVWMHGEVGLHVRGTRIWGWGRAIDHVKKDLAPWRYSGRIKSERMLLNDNETELTSQYYPDLRGDRLVGIWTGMDNEYGPISAPIILSKHVLDNGQLAAALEASRIRLVSPNGKYQTYHSN